jgi:hypothetical protein
MEPHKIKLEDLQKDLETRIVVLASSTRDHKVLQCTLKGGLQVKHNDKIVWQGTFEGDVSIKEVEMIQELKKHFKKGIPESLVKAIAEYGQEKYDAGISDESMAGADL